MFSDLVYGLDISFQFAAIAKNIDEDLYEFADKSFHSNTLLERIELVYSWCINNNVKTNYICGKQTIILLHRLSVYQFYLPSDFLLFLVDPTII